MESYFDIYLRINRVQMILKRRMTAERVSCTVRRNYIPFSHRPLGASTKRLSMTEPRPYAFQSVSKSSKSDTASNRPPQTVSPVTNSAVVETRPPSAGISHALVGYVTGRVILVLPEPDSSPACHERPERLKGRGRKRKTRIIEFGEGENVRLEEVRAGDSVGKLEKQGK